MKQVQLREKRRLNRSRARAKDLAFHTRRPRAVVWRTPRHMGVQLLDTNGVVLAYVSTMDKAVRENLPYGGNKKAAMWIGKAIAEKMLKKGIKMVIFDRSGLRYHGRVAALVDSMREAGIQV